MKPKVTFVRVVMIVDGKQRSMTFVRPEKIDELLHAKDSVGSFLRAFRDTKPESN